MENRNQCANIRRGLRAMLFLGAVSVTGLASASQLLVTPKAGSNHFSTISGAISWETLNGNPGDTIQVTADYASSATNGTENVTLTGAGYTVSFATGVAVASLDVDIVQYGVVNFAGSKLVDNGSFTVDEGYTTPWPQVYAQLDGGSIEVLGNLATYSQTFSGTTKLVIDASSQYGTATQTLTGTGTLLPTTINKGIYDTLVLQGAVTFKSPASSDTVFNLKQGQFDTTNGQVTIYGNQYGQYDFHVSKNATVFYGGWNGNIGFNSLSIGVGAGATVTIDDSLKAYDLSLFGTATDFGGTVVAPPNLEVVHSFTENNPTTTYGTPSEFFNSNYGTVTMDGVWTNNNPAGEGILSVTSPFNKLTLNLNQYNGIYVAAPATVECDLTVDGGQYPSLDGTADIYAYSNVHAKCPTLNGSGTTAIVFASSNTQAFDSSNGGRLPRVILAQPATGQINITTAVYIGGSALTGNSFDSSSNLGAYAITGRVVFELQQYQTLTIDPLGVPFNNVTIENGNWSDLTSLDTLIVTGHLNTTSNSNSTFTGNLDLDGITSDYPGGVALSSI